MVWIHGGSYIMGSGSQTSYCGANLVQKQSDIILVTINYRLNMYGFMDFSSVPGGEDFGTAPCNGTNISDEIYAATQQMWTNFARCGDPSTDGVDWKAYSADDQNILVIAGPGDIRIEQGLLADQYKAVLPLVGYYQFMDKFFTPGYLVDILAACEQGSELRW